VSSVTPAQADTGQPPCAAGDFEIAGTPLVVNTTVGAGTTASWSGISIRMRDTDTNQNNCKNTNVTLSYSTT
jgi:hypothetical protein